MWVWFCRWMLHDHFPPNLSKSSRSSSVEFKFKTLGIATSVSYSVVFFSSQDQTQWTLMILGESSISSIVPARETKQGSLPPKTNTKKNLPTRLPQTIRLTTMWRLVSVADVDCCVCNTSWIWKRQTPTLQLFRHQDIPFSNRKGKLETSWQPSRTLIATHCRLFDLPATFALFLRHIHTQCSVIFCTRDADVNGFLGFHLWTQWLETLCTLCPWKTWPPKRNELWSEDKSAPESVLGRRGIAWHVARSSTAEYKHCYPESYLYNVQLRHYNTDRRPKIQTSDPGPYSQSQSLTPQRNTQLRLQTSNCY